MSKYLAAAGLIIGSTLMLAVTPAMARVNVDLNIGVPGGYVQSGPVYVQPHPVYVQPHPAYVQPQPVYVQPQPYWNEHYWQQRQRREYQWREQREGDHDGRRNRYEH